MAELMLRGARVFDGTGSAPRLRTVAIDGDRTADIGALQRVALVVQGGQAIMSGGPDVRF